MRRSVVALVSAAALVLAQASTASAGEAAIYHTVVADHAYAEFSATNGCYQTSVWISSMDAMFAGQPGPINKQGLTAVAIIVSDTCQPPAGKGYPAVVDADGQNFASLTIDSRLHQASVATTIQVWDRVSNDVFDVPISISWVRTGPLDHSTVHNHVRFPGAGNVMANDNNLRAEAAATGSVTVHGQNLLAGLTGFATLEQVKSTCREIRFPHYEGDSDWCF